MFEPLKVYCIIILINSNIDYKEYKLVAACPIAFLDVSSKDKCVFSIKNGYLGDMIAVKSTLTGVSYTNKDRQVCNEHTDYNNTISFVM